MSLLLYNALWSVVAPLGRTYLRRSRHRELLQRFRPEAPAFEVRPIIIHACSVGEVMSALPLLEALRNASPDTPLLLSTATESGRKLALERARHVPSTWLPFDEPRSVRRFLDEVKPLALVLIETEIWPNLILESALRYIPVIVVNGRVSDKHLQRYRRFRKLFAPIFGAIDSIGAQELIYADRFTVLGTAADRVKVTGNSKFDAVKTEIEPRLRAKLRLDCGFGEDPLLLFGSTRPGDEQFALCCFERLRKHTPNLRLLLAPRHLDRIPEVLSLTTEPVYRRSDVLAGVGPRSAKIFLIDTLGELSEFYSISTLAVIGGSFLPGVEGHNPLEPAALGIPTLFGPYMKNFRHPVEVLLAADAATQVTDASTLSEALARLLENPAERRQLGTRARKAVLDNRGATGRNVELIIGAIEKAEAQLPKLESMP